MKMEQTECSETSAYKIPMPENYPEENIQVGLPTCLWRWNRQSVPKRRYIKFRRRGITQKKTYNIQNTAKVWSQEASVLFQEIPHTLWNAQVHDHTHNSSPCIPIPTHTNPIHALCSYFLIIHFNIAFPSTPRSLKWSLSIRFPHQNSVHTSPLHCTCHLLFLDFIVIIIYLSWSWATCWPVPVSRIQKSLQRSAMIPSASWGIAFHYPRYLSGFFPWNLPVVKISTEWVTGPEQGKSSGRIATFTGPEQGKSSGRIATFSLWTGVFRDGISSIPGETVIPLFLDLTTQTTFHEKQGSQSSLSSSFTSLFCCFFPDSSCFLLLHSNTFLCTLFSNTLSQCSSRPSFTPIQNNKQNYNSVYFPLHPIL